VWTSTDAGQVLCSLVQPHAQIGGRIGIGEVCGLAGHQFQIAFAVQVRTEQHGADALVGKQIQAATRCGPRVPKQPRAFLAGQRAGRHDHHKITLLIAALNQCRKVAVQPRHAATCKRLRHRVAVAGQNARDARRLVARVNQSNFGVLAGKVFSTFRRLACKFHRLHPVQDVLPIERFGQPSVNEPLKCSPGRVQ
jgi:hypothetical protein